MELALLRFRNNLLTNKTKVFLKSQCLWPISYKKLDTGNSVAWIATETVMCICLLFISIATFIWNIDHFARLKTKFNFIASSSRSQATQAFTNRYNICSSLFFVHWDWKAGYTADLLFIVIQKTYNSTSTI